MSFNLIVVGAIFLISTSIAIGLSLFVLTVVLRMQHAHRKRLARVGRACPLRRSIEAGIEFAETISRHPRGASRELVEAGGAS